MSRRCLVLAAVSVSLWLAASASAASPGVDPCPESGYFGSVGSAGSPSLTLEQRGIGAAAESSVVDTVESDALPFRVARRTWFALLRSEFGHAFSPCIYFACQGYETVDERFVIGGLPAGTDVDLRVRLDLDVRLVMLPCIGDCDFTVSSWIESAKGIDQRSRYVEAPAGSTHLEWSHEVVVDVRAGEEFQLRFGIFNSSSDQLSSVETAARWSFLGLPEGAQVNPCLAQTVPTPARVTTWGMLKSAYR